MEIIKLRQISHNIIRASLLALQDIQIMEIIIKVLLPRHKALLKHKGKIIHHLLLLLLINIATTKLILIKLITLVLHHHQDLIKIGTQDQVHSNLLFIRLHQDILLHHLLQTPNKLTLAILAIIKHLNTHNLATDQTTAQETQVHHLLLMEAMEQQELHL